MLRWVKVKLDSPVPSAEFLERAAAFPFKHNHLDRTTRRKTLNPITVRNRTITMSSPESSPWSCKKCTFLNSPSQKHHCLICLSLISPSSSPSSSSGPKWACKACTFLNPLKNSLCDICGTLAPVSRAVDTSLDDGDGGDPDCSVGSVFLPLRRCKRKARDDAVLAGAGGDESAPFRDTKLLHKEVAKKGSDEPLEKKIMPLVATLEQNKSLEEAHESGSQSVCLKILSYNVWFREDLELYRRMKAIGDLIQLHSPDLICFQEVTPNIYNIFQQSNWWKTYRCSVSNEAADSRAYFCMQLSKLPVKSFSCKPFGNSIMGRELCIAEVEVAGHRRLVLATSHLESPCPAPPKWDQMFSRERVDQAKESLKTLERNRNVIFGGDLNWDDKLDGKVPLPEGWVDAWEELKPGDDGFTYDTKSNQMLSGNRKLQKRLDRFLCCLNDFTIGGIEMIGKEEIPGLSYWKEKKVRNEVKKLELPVLPSDHYGLLLTIRSQ